MGINRVLRAAVAALLALGACATTPEPVAMPTPTRTIETVPVPLVEPQARAAELRGPVAPDAVELRATNARVTIDGTAWIVQIGVGESAGNSWMSGAQVADAVHGHSYALAACYLSDIIDGGDDLTHMIGVHAEVNADGTTVASHVTYAPEAEDVLAQCVADVIAATDFYSAEAADLSTAGLDIAVEFRASAPL